MFARATYDGVLNLNAIKRMRRAIELLIAISEPKEAVHFKTNKKFVFRINFITLTLPAPQREVTDKQLKKSCLDPWLKHAKRNFNLRNFVWRAERQKNGNLHFHIVSDCYVHYMKLRESWNHQLAKFHFLDEYHAKHNKWNPNSTDVHSVNNIRDLSRYISKYMSKLKKQDQRIEGAVWDCSKNLKRKDSVEFEIDSSTHQMINIAINDMGLRSHNTDHCLFIWYSEKDRDKLLTGRHAEAFKQWLDSIKN